MSESEPARLLPDFESALTFAARLHSSQSRKGSNIPYIAHLLSVAALVLEYGGGRDEVIAALLHDSIEDQAKGFPGGATALRARISEAFGPPVLAIVEGCTDADTVPKPLWRERKERYIAHVRHASDAIRLVSCADKLHNARTIVADLREIGPAVFERFKGGRDGTLWYYESLAKVFTVMGPKALAAELHRTVAAMKALASARAESLF